MIPRATFDECVRQLGQIAADDIEWSENLEPPANAICFAREIIFVICNSGMKNTVARGIYDRCIEALNAGKSSGEVFGHKGKTGAIDRVWADRYSLFHAYMRSEDKLAWLQDLPWIGPITVWHLAKNFAVGDVAKPDVHLKRLAALHKTTPQELCADLALVTGYRISTVDTILWRACANGVMDSRTGLLRQQEAA